MLDIDDVKAYTATVLDTNINDVKRMFDINLFGLLAVTHHVTPLLKAKGTIVNTESIADIMAGPYSSFYNGSKVSVEFLSHAMRQEMEPLSLKVVHVCWLITIGNEELPDISKVTTGLVATHVQEISPAMLLKHRSTSQSRRK